LRKFAKNVQISLYKQDHWCNEQFTRLFYKTVQLLGPSLKDFFQVAKAALIDDLIFLPNLGEQSLINFWKMDFNEE
jgi:hypothetical protein